MNNYNKLSIPDGVITSGYGEYYVFNQKGLKIERGIYEEVYAIFDRFSSAQCVANLADRRFEIIRKKVKEIQADLEIGFIPRVLYELIFIRKCIKEDLKHGPCKFGYKGAEHQIKKEPNEEATILAEMAARKCWHFKSFIDEDNNQDDWVKQCAFRINRAIVKTLAPQKQGFTYLELKQKVQNEIHYLENFYNHSNEISFEYGESVTCNVSSQANCFMGVKNQADAQIILNALAVECSQIAQNAFLLYRGFKDVDHVVKKDGEIYRLSYGSGLFAGCVYDSTATAFYYMRKEGFKAIAIPVPCAQLNSSIFYIPPTNAVTQLFGKGEYFHGMTKKWKDGVNWDDSPGPYEKLGERRKHYDSLNSTIEKDDFIEIFRNYSSQAISL